MVLQLNEANTSMVRLIYIIGYNRFTAVHGGRAIWSNVVLEKEKERTHQSSVNINNLQEK